MLTVSAVDTDGADVQSKLTDASSKSTFSYSQNVNTLNDKKVYSLNKKIAKKGKDSKNLKTSTSGNFKDSRNMIDKASDSGKLELSDDNVTNDNKIIIPKKSINIDEKELSANNGISKKEQRQEIDFETSDEPESFSQLQKIIDETETFGTITLTKDYKADKSQKNININKSITIIGNGHTLDANYLDKIFEISLKSSDVVKFYDLTLINGCDCADIRIYGGNLYLIGCLIKDRVDNRKISRKSSSIFSTKSNLYLTDNTIIFTGSAIYLYSTKCIVNSCNFVGDNRNNGAISVRDRTINVNRNGTFVKVSNSVFYNTASTTKFDIFSEKSEVYADDNWWGSNKNVKSKNLKGKVNINTWYYLDVNQNVIGIGETTPITFCLKSNINGSKISYPLNYSISDISATNATVLQSGKKIYYTPTKGNSGDISLTFTYYNVSTKMTFNIKHVGKEIIVNNYDELANALDNLQKVYFDEGTITLRPGNYNATRNIKLTSSNSIRKIIINGNNNIIDGNDKYKFIEVQGVKKPIDYLSLTIANTTFQNFKSVSDNGSVIDINITSGDLNIENSKFNNNNALYGGVIFVNGLNSINVKDSSFINNSATNYGGVMGIYSSQKANLFNTTFVENHARVGGAAFIYTKQTDIKNSNFVSNKATYGGALNYISEVTISDSQFLNNSATENAGAIYRTGKLTINNVTFFNNSPQDYEYTGGAEDIDYIDDNYNNHHKTYYSVSKKQFKVMDKVILTGNNEQTIIKNNQLTLNLLNQIFNMDFRNGHLLVYIDGKLVFNGTTADDLTQVLYDLLKTLTGNHEIKVEYTDKNGNMNNYTESIIL